MTDLEQVALLTEYSQYLEKYNYLDCDWWAESPNAVDRFLEEREINLPQQQGGSFDDFWILWPKKQQKALAIKAWGKLTSNEQNLAIADLRSRPAKDKGWTDKQFIPYPATYLNQKRWGDQYEEVTHEPTFDELLAQNLTKGHSDPVQHDETPLSIVYEQNE